MTAAAVRPSVQEVGHELVDQLPEEATLKDLSDLALHGVSSRAGRRGYC